MKPHISTIATILALVVIPTAHAQSAGTWLGRLGMTTIAPQVTSGVMTAPSFEGTKSDVSSASQVSGGVTYMYTDNISIDVPLALPFTHKLYGAGALAGAGQIGEVQALPMTAFLQYRFMEADSPFRPYVGIGATYAYFFNAKGGAALTAMTNPGFVQTPLTAKNSFSMPALLSPEQAADAMLQGWARGQFEIHFPRRFTVWMKLLRIMPVRWYFYLVRKATA